MSKEQEAMIKARLLVTRVVVGTLQESINVIVSHVLIYEFLAYGEESQSVREIRNHMKERFEFFCRTCDDLLKRSWFFMKYPEQLRTLEKLLREVIDLGCKQ